MEDPVAWFVIRSSGLVAVALLTASVVLGLVAPRLLPAARLAAFGLHRAAAGAGSVLVMVHVVLAVLDAWIDLDWRAALIPGVAAWEPVGVALGAVALDLLVVVLLTTWMRQRSPSLWKRMHLAAYPLWALSVGHGLLVGTDGAAMAKVAVVAVAAVLLALSWRLLGSTPSPRAAEAGRFSRVAP